MKTLRNMSDYSWKHDWAFLPTHFILWGIWVVALPYWVWRRDRDAEALVKRASKGAGK